MPSSQAKLRLPQIKTVALHQFSLFTANPDAEFSCGEGVLCLVGANGIGKSTLLSAINFCLTGIVSDPGRKFESMEEYYKHSLQFSERYFDGRISEDDRTDAEISVGFRVGQYLYQIKRGLFEPEELRELSVTDTATSQPVLTTTEDTRREKHAAYVASLIQHIGLTTFPEFVFLQHFVFTFDEQRKTIFWDQKILERVLYLAFGLDPNMAKRVDDMRRDIEQADSQVRNKQWDATKLRKRINEQRTKMRQASASQESYDALSGEHESLTKQYEEQSAAVEAIEKDLKDSNLRLAEFSARESALREEYAEFFDRRFDRRPPLSQNPIIAQTISDKRCRLCGEGGSTVVVVVQRKAAHDACPLCDSKLVRANTDDTGFKRLQEIDQELTKTKDSIRSVLRTLTRLRGREETASAEAQATKAKLDEFDNLNQASMDALRRLLNEKGGSDALLAAYRDQLNQAEKEKNDAYARRTRLRKELLGLQAQLQVLYVEAERTFVPSFTGLAHLFLGMPLEVRMDSSKTSGLNLVVGVRGENRRQPHDLSESQRFFLDIALRMALTQFMSNPEAKGGMYIDTPEGSLDIAYEKRAGDMLSKFVAAGNPVLMTANLNSSKLLLSLARNCKRERMRLVRMTDWSELSEVQVAEEHLFDEAFAEIEKAMGE